MALTEIGKTRTKLEHLATQLAVANTHLHFYEKLRPEQIGKMRHEFYKSKDFWGFTLGAHIQIAMLHLCRIYDGNKKAIHMFRFLKEIPVTRFSPSDKAQMQADLAALNQASLSPSLKKLREWRNKLIAHSNYELSIEGPQDFLKQHSITLKEIHSLIDDGFSILERWAYHCEDEFFQNRIDQGKSARRTFRRLAEGKDDDLYLLKKMDSDTVNTAQPLAVTRPTVACRTA
jgi:hypothetical protein